MIRTIATDLDGTLFYPKSRFRLIKDKNCKFLVRFLKTRGNNLVLVSGRNITMAKKIQKKLETDRLAMIACNGACVYYHNKIIEEHPLSKDEVRFLYEYAKKNENIHILLFFTNLVPHVITTNNLSKPMEIIGKLGMNMQFAYYEKYAIGDEEFEKYFNDPKCKFYKVMPCFGFGKKAIQLAKEEMSIFQKEIGDKFELMWSNNTIEIMKKNVNKANALKNLLNMLELKKTETAVVGDSGNDIPLFEEFEQSFCMMQAQEEVKNKAKTLIKGVYEIEKYL